MAKGTRALRVSCASDRRTVTEDRMRFELGPWVGVPTDGRWLSVAIHEPDIESGPLIVVLNHGMMVSTCDALKIRTVADGLTSVGSVVWVVCSTFSLVGFFLLLI